MACDHFVQATPQERRNEEKESKSRLGDRNQRCWLVEHVKRLKKGAVL